MQGGEGEAWQARYRELPEIGEPWNTTEGGNKSYTHKLNVTIVWRRPQ